PHAALLVRDGNDHVNKRPTSVREAWPSYRRVVQLRSTNPDGRRIPRAGAAAGSGLGLPSWPPPVAAGAGGYILYLPRSSRSRLSSHFWRRSLSPRSGGPSSAFALSMTDSST